MKKRNLIISILVITIMAITLVVVGYFMRQSNVTQNIQEIAKERENDSEREEVIENNEDNKLSSINIQAMKTAETSQTVTIQQGNLYAYVDTTLKSSPENSGQFRTTFGIGEKVVLVAQFDKLVKSAPDAKIIIQFGSGSLIQVNGRVSGSTIVFEHTLRENIDNGQMQVKGLSGTVTDNDDNTIQIGLPQSGIQYTQSNSIIADTTKPVLTEYSIESPESYKGFVITAKFVYNDTVYIKENNTLRSLTSEELESLVYVTFKSGNEEYRGKGFTRYHSVTLEDGKTVCTYQYVIGSGDFGTPVVWMKPVSDIAGNLNKQSDTGVIGTEIAVDTGTHTPYVTAIECSANGNNVQANEGTSVWNYCNAGKTITINVTFNETVYANREQQELTAENANNIYLNIGGAVKEAKFSGKLDDRRTITYTYTIQPGDNGDLELITIPDGLVYDNVGHKSISSTKDSLFIVIDTVAPTAIIETITQPGIYKSENWIQFKLKSSEPVTGGKFDAYFSELSYEKRHFNDSYNTGFTEERTYGIKITKGENGYLIVNLEGTGFEDKAGNPIAATEFACKNIYADTVGPTIEINSNKKITNGNIVTYTFSLNDNSDDWEVVNGVKKGVADNTFTLDDILITNGTVINSSKDTKGNISSIEVLANQDGVQKIYVGKEKFEDTAGNTNEQYKISDNVIIDNKLPVITNIDKSPSDWTNQDVTVTVYANDDISGILGYAFNHTYVGKENSCIINANGIVDISVIDNAENRYDTTIKVDNIDKVPPTLEISKQENGNESATITINANDELSGIKSCEINGVKVILNNNSYEFKVNENNTYNITVYDKAGNGITKSIEINNINETIKDANIIYETNGGKFNLSNNSKITLSDNIYVTNVAINKIEYAWTKSKSEPTTWIDGGNVTKLSVEQEITEEGTYYLHTRVTDKDNHITKSCSNAFIVEGLAINIEDTVTIESFQNENYIILSKPTAASELLEKITSNKHTIKIKNKDLTQDSTENLKTGDAVVAEGANNEVQYRIVLKGDINSDGQIDMSDIFKLNKYRLGKLQLDNDELLAADVNNDKTINMKDIFQINKYRLGKIENL